MCCCSDVVSGNRIITTRMGKNTLEYKYFFLFTHTYLIGCIVIMSIIITGAGQGHENRRVCVIVLMIKS